MFYTFATQECVYNNLYRCIVTGRWWRNIRRLGNERGETFMVLCPVNVLTISGNRPCFITGIQKRCPKGDQIWRFKKTKFCKILIFSMIQNLEVPRAGLEPARL